MAPLRTLLFGAGLMPLIPMAAACTGTDVIQGGSSAYTSFWSTSAGPTLKTFSVVDTGGPDGGAYLEIDDFSYSWVIVRQNIPSVQVGTSYHVSLGWSITTDDSTGASCTIAVAVEGNSFTAASAALVAGRSSGWSSVSGTYTPTSSTGIPFVITISCSQGASNGNPVVGLADISMVSACSDTVDSTSSAVSTTSSDDSLGSLTTALSTLTSPTPAASSTASSASTATWSTSSDTTATTDDNGTTLTADTTAGTSLEASQSVDTSDDAAVSGTISVSDSAATKRKRSGVSCALSIYQGNDLLDSLTVPTGSSAHFSTCLSSSSSSTSSTSTLTIKVVCDGTGATVEVADLTVDTSLAAVEQCAAGAAGATTGISAAAASSPIAAQSSVVGAQSSAIAVQSSSSALSVAVQRPTPSPQANPQASPQASSSVPLFVTRPSPSTTPSPRPSSGSVAGSDSSESGSSGAGSPGSSGSDSTGPSSASGSSGVGAGFKSSGSSSSNASGSTGSGSSSDSGSSGNVTGASSSGSGASGASSSVVSQPGSGSTSNTSGSSNAISGAGTFTTSTISHTEVHTVTACPSTIQNCPASAKTTYLTTETVVDYTTICPVTATETQVPATATRALSTSRHEEFTISTVYTTSVHTVTTCPSSVKDCPASKQTTYLTTETIVDYTTICPVTATHTGVAATASATSTAGSLSRVTEYVTSTMYSTLIRTVTACPSGYKNCPASAKSTFVTTETVPVHVTTYTMVATEPHTTAAPAGEQIYSTSTGYDTTVNTVTAVPMGSTDQTAAQETVSVYTTLIPVGTTVYLNVASIAPATAASGAIATEVSQPEGVEAIGTTQSTTKLGSHAQVGGSGAQTSSIPQSPSLSGSLIPSFRASPAVAASAAASSRAGTYAGSATTTAGGALYTGAATSVSLPSGLICVVGSLVAALML